MVASRPHACTDSSNTFFSLAEPFASEDQACFGRGDKKTTSSQRRNHPLHGTAFLVTVHSSSSRLFLLLPDLHQKKNAFSGIELAFRAWRAFETPALT